MPLPGSPLRSVVSSAARIPASSEGASTTRPPSSGSGSAPTLRSMVRASPLSTIRVAPQWPVTRTRSPSQPGSARMPSSTANAAHGAVAGGAGAASGGVERRAWPRVGGAGDPARGRRAVARAGDGSVETAAVGPVRCAESRRTVGFEQRSGPRGRKTPSLRRCVRRTVTRKLPHEL